ncbi:MAG: hypothetical protein POELPBGB_01032 [Bacteroidia bacterium]|nr:hypothetical protein [Bacteroidia bacterium]
MARLILPEDFLSQKLLFNNVKAKADTATGAAVIGAFLAAQGIDLVADNTAKDSATAFDQTRSEKSKQAENFTQKRDLKFDPVFGHLRDYAQFLKKFYKPVTSELGNWGLPVTATGRINYPTEFGLRTEIMEAFSVKYASVPAASNPLNPYLALHNYSITDDMVAVTDARGFHEQAKQLAKDAEDATEDRNNVWLPVVEHVRSIGGFLMGLYNNNPKELGNWGFVVDDSPRAPKQVVSKVKLSSQLKVPSLIIGGTLKNIGTVAIHIYKGASVSGSPVIVPPGEMYGIAKGYSVITVVNPSTTTTAVFSALRSR